MLNYLGQAAWLLKVYQDPAYQQIENLNPFSRLCLKVGPFLASAFLRWLQSLPPKLYFPDLSR